MRCLYRPCCIDLFTEYPTTLWEVSRWGMAIQELDLHICHRSGKNNANADALSRSPLAAGKDLPIPETEGVIAAIEEETNLSAYQRRDQNLADIIHYLETGILPADDRLRRNK